VAWHRQRSSKVLTAGVSMFTPPEGGAWEEFALCPIARLPMVMRCRSKPVEPRVDSVWFQRLKQNCDKLLSNFAINFNLRHYTKGLVLAPEEEEEQAAEFVICRPRDGSYWAYNTGRA